MINVLHLSAIPCHLFWRRLLSRLRRPVGRFETELLGVLGVQSLPAAELHGLGADIHTLRIGIEGNVIVSSIPEVTAGSSVGDAGLADKTPLRSSRSHSIRT